MGELELPACIKTANKQVEKLAAEFSRCDQNLENAKPQKKNPPPTWVGGSILLTMLFRIYDLACSINLAHIVWNLILQHLIKQRSLAQISSEHHELVACHLFNLCHISSDLCKLINRLQTHISLEKIQNLLYLINRLAHISQSKNSESLIPDHHSCSHFLQKIMVIL